MLGTMSARAVLSLLVFCFWPASSAHAQAGFAGARSRSFASAPPSEVVFVNPPLALPPRLAARELLLTRDFSLMRDESKGRAWMLGGVLALSATLIGVGSAYPRQVGALLLPLGAIGLLRGIVGLTLQKNPRVAADAYLRMPSFTAEQVRTRLRLGEEALAAQARTERRARIVDGSVSCAIATSYVPLAWYIARRHDPSYRFRSDGFGWALLALSVINAASSLVTALAPTPNEQRYQAYRTLVAQQERESPGELDRLVDSLSFQLSGTRQRLELSAQARF
ncbi:MAG: hypothetical protein JWN04_5275 [Myxococcaceae bacterium]|nr:hypothetical protein [Myxococcaceae bacterium]